MKEREHLIEISEHIAYEIWMLRLCAFLLISEKDGLYASTTTNEFIAYTDYVDEPVYSSSETYSPPSDDENSVVQRNALIEAFAVHLRALLEFFFLNSPKYNKRDDILAIDFFEDPKLWTDNRPDLSQMELQNIMDRVNKEVVHITLKRIDITQADKTWPILYFKEIVLKAKLAFESCVDQTLLSEKWN